MCIMFDNIYIYIAEYLISTGAPADAVGHGSAVGASRRARRLHTDIRTVAVSLDSTYVYVYIYIYI